MSGSDCGNIFVWDADTAKYESQYPNAALHFCWNLCAPCGRDIVCARVLHW